MLQNHEKNGINPKRLDVQSIELGVNGNRVRRPSMSCHRSLRAAMGISLLCGASFLFAQSERGTISGTVRDSTAAVTPKAKIIVTNTATNVVVHLTTNELGEYTAASVPVGVYNIQVQKEGFRPAEIKGLSVNAATSVRADVNLEIGQSQQVDEVQ